MTKLKVYYNPKCSKCRTAKKFLDKNKKDYEIFEYMNGDLTVKKLKDIMNKGNLVVDDIVRKNEDEYSHFIKGKNLDDEEILKIIVRHPKLLQRPIILTENSAIVARDDNSLNEVKSLE